MKKQYKLIFAILFGFNVLLTVVDIVIGASFPTIALSISTAVWIAIHYKSTKEYAELMCSYIKLRIEHIRANVRFIGLLNVVSEGLTREWASPEEFEKWKEERMKELFKDENTNN